MKKVIWQEPYRIFLDTFIQWRSKKLYVKEMICESTHDLVNRPYFFIGRMRNGVCVELDCGTVEKRVCFKQKTIDE